MEVRLFGAGKTVTGSCYGLKAKADRILIDCGMFQGNKRVEKWNYDPFIFDPKFYQAVILTHAHLDHCGRIPKLIKEGFKGKIYCTEVTKELAYIVMMDAAKISSHDVAYENEKRAEKKLPPREPIYEESDVNEAIKRFVTINYHEPVQITKNIIAKFYEAGHILGAASIQLYITEGNRKIKVAFSGDLGQTGTPIVRSHDVITEADYVFVESTYGDRLHEEMGERRNKLLNIIRETCKKGGKLLIPSFAIERAQELLYDLNALVEKNLIPKIPIFIDSPMAIRATEVFKNHPEFYNKEVKQLLESGDNPFSFPGLVYTKTVQESKDINLVKGSCIIIAGSGMCTAGRIKHHIKNYIDDPKNTILFVGYQVEGTLGYWIKKGEKRVRLLGTEVSVNAKVESIDSFSGHADYEDLLDWMRHFNPKPKKVFITHGDERSAKSFEEKLQKRDFITYIPDMKEKLVL